jgi:hypothetical protein
VYTEQIRLKLIHVHILKLTVILQRLIKLYLKFYRKWSFILAKDRKKRRLQKKGWIISSPAQKCVCMLKETYFFFFAVFFFAVFFAAVFFFVAFFLTGINSFTSFLVVNTKTTILTK